MYTRFVMFGLIYYVPSVPTTTTAFSPTRFQLLFLVFLPFHKRNVGIPAVRAILQAADDCCRPQPPPSMLFSTCDCRVAATPMVYFSCRANPARRWFTIPRLLNHSSFRSAPNSSTWDFTGEWTTSCYLAGDEADIPCSLCAEPMEWKYEDKCTTKCCESYSSCSRVPCWYGVAPTQRDDAIREFW